MTDHVEFRRILVGVDDEGIAGDAIMQGFELAASLGAGLDFVHGVDLALPSWSTVAREELGRMHATALEGARRAVTTAARPFIERSGHTIAEFEERLTATIGHPAQALWQTAEDRDADLIVIGPHERRTWFDFGSTLRAVLAATHRPTLVQAGPYAPIRRILVPVDLSPDAERVLALASALARPLDASVTVLHCYESKPVASGFGDYVGPVLTAAELEERIRGELTLMARTALGTTEAEIQLAEALPVPEILEHAQRADLIVMGTHGRTGLMRALLGSVAYGVIGKSSRPVLVVPNAKRTWLLGQERPVAAQVGT